MADVSRDLDARPTNVRWIVFALGCGTSWMLYLHRYVFALIKPELQQEWGLSKTELGVYDGVFSTCYSALQFPLGLLTDFAGPHLMLGGAILVWSFGLGLHAWVGGPSGLWWARAVLGSGQAGVFASVSRVSKTWFPASIRTTVQGWMAIFSARTGAMSANLVFGALLLGVFALPWRSAINIFTAAGLLLGIAFIICFRNSPRRHPWANAAEAGLIEGPITTASGDTPRQRTSIGEMLRRTSPRSRWNLAFLTTTSTLSTMADNIYVSWVPLFLAEEHGLNYKQMGLLSSLPLLGGAIGGGVSGLVNDWLILKTGNRRWTRSLIGLGGKGMAGVVLLGALLVYDRPLAFCALLVVVKFFADVSLATRWGTVTDIGGNVTASVFSLNNALAGLGAIAASPLFGYLADNYGWQPIFPVVIGMYWLNAASWLAVDCTVPVLAEEGTGDEG